MAPFRPAAPCVLSAGGVDDRKSIELWLSLHTSDSFPVEQCLCEERGLIISQMRSLLYISSVN